MVWFWERGRSCRGGKNFLRNLRRRCNEKQNSKKGSSINSFTVRINLSLFILKSNQWRTYGISKEIRSEIIRSNDISDGLHRKMGSGLCKLTAPGFDNGYVNAIFMSVHKCTARCSLNWTLNLVTHFVEMYRSYPLKNALWGLKHAGMLSVNNKC